MRKGTRLPNIPNNNMPSRAGGRPLPPEPPKDNTGPPPPPLPSRPKAPPSIPNGGTQGDEPMDYLEPDDWTADEAPVLPPRNFSPGPEETYEVPDLPPPQPPPLRSRAGAQPPPTPESADSDGEVYDELEGIREDKNKPLPKAPSPEPAQFEGEIYDQCDVQEQNEETGGELYEETEMLPQPEEDGGEIYEVPDENTPAPGGGRHNAPLPPPPPGPKAPLPPATNTMPAPIPVRAPGQAAPKLQALKNRSGDGPTNLGISLDMIGAKKNNLRKVSLDKEPEKIPPVVTNNEDAPDTSSVKARLDLFKQMETDDDANENSLQSQLFNAMNSLRKGSPLRNATDNNTYFTQENRPTMPSNSDTSKLSIQQRIAMMKGKNIGGINVTSPSKTNLDSPKNDCRDSLQTKNSSANKPPMPLKPNGLQKQNWTAKNVGNNFPKMGRHSIETLLSGQKPNLRPKPQFQFVSSAKPTVAVSPTSRVGSVTPVSSKGPSQQQAPPPAKPAPIKSVQPSPPPYEEEIYDDATSIDIPKDPLNDEIWYHGERERKDCEQNLTSKGQDGSYLVRKSKQGGDTQPYTLVVLYKGHVYNLKIRRREDEKIALGEAKDGEMPFDSVPELIKYHTSNEVILINRKEDMQYKTFLKAALRVT